MELQQKEKIPLAQPGAPVEPHQPHQLHQPQQPQQQQQQPSTPRGRRFAQVNSAFLENSIPAIRKLARSPNCCHRVFWSTVFLATFTGFVVHLVSITVRFRATPVSTETRVERVDAMPSILICPQNYISGTRIVEMLSDPNPLLQNMTFKSIYNEILPMFWNFIYTVRDSGSDRKMVGMKIKSNFLWYLIHVWGRQGQIQHEKHDVFLHIGAQDLDDFTMDDVATTFDSQRNRCFAWEPKTRSTSPLTAVLNVPDGRYFYAEQDAFELVSDSGLWLHICFNQSYGCHDSIRYFLRTGHYTKIDLRKMVVSQLPVGNKTSCATGDRVYLIKQDPFVLDSDTLRVAYTSAMCTDLQLQRRIHARCGCLSALLPTEIDLFNAALTASGNPRDLFCSLPPDEAFTHGQFSRQCREDPMNDTRCTVPPLDASGPDDPRSIPFRQLLARDAIRRFLQRDDCHDAEFKVRIPVSVCPKVCRREQFSSVHSVVPWPESQLSRAHASTFARIFVNTVRPFLDRAISRLDNSSGSSCVLEAMRAAFLDGMNFSQYVSAARPKVKPLYEKGLNYMQERLLLLR